MHPADGPVLDDARLRDPARLEALTRTGLLGTGDDPAFDRWARMALEVTGASAALLSLVDDERAFFKAFQLAGGGAGGGREVPIAHSLCRELVVRAETFVVTDATTDPRARGYRAVRAFPVGAYAGIPVRDEDGHVLGALCVVDPAPRAYAEAELEGLARAAAATELELRLRVLARSRADARAVRDAHERVHRLMLDGAPLARALRVLELALEAARPGLRAEVRLGTPPAAGTEPGQVAEAWSVTARGGATASLRGDRPRRVTRDCLELLGEAARLAVVAAERDAARRQLLELAGTDSLTGLPNRDRTLEALQARLDHGRPVAVLFCDLDRFKLVNDSAGHEAGDEVLAQVAERLRQAAAPWDVVGRLGGDEFVVLTGAAAPAETAAALREAVTRPVRLPGGREHVVGVSVGMALVRGGTAREALRRADAAMYAAKAGPRRVALHDAALDDRNLRELRIVDALAGAPARGELRLVFQPIVDLATGTPRALEALLRWRHPELGDVPPGLFVPIAEDHRLMAPIERWVVRTAARCAAGWNAGPGPRLPVSVNLSASRLADGDAAAEVLRAILDARLHPRLLQVEITETAVLADLGPSAQALAQLREAGVAVHLDDFGTGFSSLDHLRTLPIDAVKIDRAFVAGMGAPAGRALVTGLVALATGLGLDVVAEGVETAEQGALLHGAGCGLVQGWRVARPQEEEAVAAWLAGRRDALAA